MDLFPDFIRRQFRSCRNIALPHSAILAFYSNEAYSQDVFEREVTNGLPSMRPGIKVPVEAPAIPSPGVPQDLPIVAPVKILPPPVSILRPQLSWPEMFVPRCAEEFFGQEKPLRRLMAWLSSGDCKSSFVTIHGPSGTGKSSLARFLLPGAMQVNFESYSHEAVRFCMRGGKSFSETTKKFAGLIVQDYTCLSEAAQKYLLDIMIFCSKKTFPIPIIFVMGDVPTSFARATKAFCLRIHTNRLTQKMLIALGYSLLRRTGHTMPNQYNTLLQCARTSNNAHHFIAALEDIVTRYRHNFFGTTDQEFSPFEVVRRCWTGQGNSFYHDPATVHWVAQNSTQLLKSVDTLSSFASSMSQWDSLYSRLSMGDRSNEVGCFLSLLVSQQTHFAIQSSAIGNDLLREVPIDFPQSLRREIGVPSSNKKKSPLENALNFCF